MLNKLAASMVCDHTAEASPRLGNLCGCGGTGIHMFIIYGPYKRKDGRKHLVLYDTGIKSKQTVSYPKYLVEQHYRITLKDNETVDHINNDFSDDSLENLQVLDRATNIRKALVNFHPWRR